MAPNRQCHQRRFRTVRVQATACHEAGLQLLEVHSSPVDRSTLFRGDDSHVDCFWRLVAVVRSPLERNPQTLRELTRFYANVDSQTFLFVY